MSTKTLDRCIFCAQEVENKEDYLCKGCQVKKDFVLVAKNCGLEGLTRKRYVLYMEKRWRLSEIGEPYAKEWARWFKNGTEYGYADDVGKSILNVLSFIKE